MPGSVSNSFADAVLIFISFARDSAVDVEFVSEDRTDCLSFAFEAFRSRVRLAHAEMEQMRASSSAAYEVARAFRRRGRI